MEYAGTASRAKLALEGRLGERGGVGCAPMDEAAAGDKL